MNFVRLAVALLLSIETSLCAAQNVPAGTTANPDNSKEGIVYAHILSRVRFESDGTGTRETSAEIKIQSEAGVQQFGVLNVAYTSANETLEIRYVRARKPDGSVVTTPEYNIQDMPAEVTRSAPMYSDIHEKHIVVKGLAVGDVLEYQIQYRTTKPEVPNQFWYEYSFLTDAIVLDERLEIDVPADKAVRVTSPAAPPEVKETGGRRTYSWKTSNLKRKEPDPIPRREAPAPSVQVTSFKSWEEVGRWYAGLQQSQVVVTPAIRAKADALTKGVSGDDEKMRALYDFVSTGIHYVSLSFGIGRYQPHPADDVLSNGYGDCKDKHTLLAALLKAEGYESWPVLVNGLRQLDADTPSPGQFNHLITAVPRGNRTEWLDTTPEVAPYGLLLANLRGKQALVMPGGSAPSLMKLPEVPPMASNAEFVAEGKLDSEGTLHAHVQRKTSGEQEVLFRLGFRNVSQAQWKDLVQRVSYASGFGGEVSNVSASSPTDTSKPFDFSYDYVRKNYSDWENHRISPPLPPFGVEVDKNDDKKPSEPFYLGAPGELVYRAKVEMPPGYTLAVPKKVDAARDYAEYHATYSFDKGVFTAERKLIIKKPEIGLSQWEDYRTFRNIVADDENNYAPLAGAGENLVASDAERQLFNNAGAAMRQGDCLGAAEIFRQLLAKNDTYPRAHAGLGFCYLNVQRVDEGISELLKEEELHPADTYAYRVLWDHYNRAGKDDKALDQLLGLTKADPTDRTALSVISDQLVSRGRNAEAIQLLESAVNQAPDSTDIRLSLGRAYLRSGQKEKGASMIIDAANADSTNENLEMAASALAESNASVDKATEFADKALQGFESQSAADSEFNDHAARNAVYLCGIWGVEAQVQLDRGELDRAMKFGMAAWKLCQWEATGKVVAEVLEHQGKRAEAAHLYRLAYAGEVLGPRSFAAPQKKAIADAYQKLTGKEISVGPELTRRRGATYEPWPGDELSRMRTFSIASSQHEIANATFGIMFSPGKIEQVNFLSGDASLKNMTRQLQSAKILMDFPDAGPVRVARQGILSCGGGGCSLVLLLPNRVHFAP